MKQISKFQLKELFKKKWLKRLDRYIIVKFLGTYFFAIALIISIAVVFDVNENIDHFINNKARCSSSLRLSSSHPNWLKTLKSLPCFLPE